MNSLEIYFDCYDSYTEKYAIPRGYRWDIIVKTDANYFLLNAYDLSRLSQDSEEEIRLKGSYDVAPNLILVKDVSNMETVKTIKRLYETNYFDEIKPLNLISGDIKKTMLARCKDKWGEDYLERFPELKNYKLTRIFPEPHIII